MPRLRHKKLLWVSGSFHADRHALPARRSDRTSGRYTPPDVILGYDYTEIEGDKSAMESHVRFAFPWLADNECSHGSLPGDREIFCRCWNGSAKEIVKQSLQSSKRLRRRKTG